MAIGDSECVRGIQFLGHVLLRNMHEPLQHTGHLLFGGMSVAGDRHLDLHRRVFVDRHIFGERGGNSHPLRMDNLDHRLGVLVHKLRLYRQAGWMVFVNNLLQKKELLLQARVLPFEFMHIICAKLQNVNLLSDSMQHRVPHKERTRVNPQNDMFFNLSHGFG